MKNNYRKQLFKERKEVGDMFGKKKIAIKNKTMRRRSGSPQIFK
jgi:hypothetical protein